MSFLRKLIWFLLFLAPVTSSFAGGSGGVSPYAYELFRVPGLDFPVTNAMVTGWAISLILILVVRLVVGGKPQLVPSRGQSLLESVLIGVRDTMEPIVGPKMIRPTFPLLIGFFFFILIMNWSGMFPGVGSFGHLTEDGSFRYYFRPSNSDMNMTIALAVVSFVAWLWYVLRYAGLKTLIFDIFGNKADKKEVPIYIFYPLFLVFILVGLIETVSILSRLVSLSFRLYGNVFGGENLLTNMLTMHPILGFFIPVPFYFLELLIGLVQALVFTLLTAVYIGLICNHESGEHEGDHH